MAKRVIWTLAAWNDLETVADFISQDSPYYAAAWVRNVRDAARSLNLMSMRDRVVPKIGDRQIRELIVQSYRLVYKVERLRVAVLGIIHGARDLKTLWVRRTR
jgi:plasmid stabilization system protein ParE